MNQRPGHGGRRVLLLCLAVVALAVVLAANLLPGRDGGGDTHAGAAGSPSAQVNPSPSPAGPLSTGPGSAAERELQQLRDMPLPRPVASAGAARIAEQARHQPDLYAASFLRALLTQDFRRARDEHLAWVVSESAVTAEPLVVGLVPEDLRNRLALYSVTNASAGSTPIPPPDEWVRLAALDGYTTVSDVRVSEPLAWTNAVDAGRVTDPGITARTVTATVTTHTVVDRQARSTAASVSITANFEGPPTRPTWGFVTAVMFTSMALGPQAGQA